MPSKSKTKGNAAERMLCQILTKMFGGNFMRVPNSGAFIGGANFARKQVLTTGQNRIFRGDIIPPDSMPKLVLEAKFYAEFQYHALLTPGPIPMLDGWIKQTLDAIDATDVWFVAFKANRRNWNVAFPHEQLGSYELDNHALYSGAHGKFVVTDLIAFFTMNKDRVCEKCR